MRSLNDEKGAVAVTVALLMVVLIGFAALAIDISSLYQERRALQNGADAGALAVAKDCAGTGCTGPTARDQADDYADLNADDGESNIDEVCGTGLPVCAGPPPTVPAGTTGYVRVTTSTNEVSSPDNPTEVNFEFAPVFDLVAPGDHDGKTMRATAVAAWGPPGAATTLPLTFSRCEYDNLIGDLEPPFTDSHIYFHGTNGALACPTRPGQSGTDLPGGFGWLEEGADCEVTINVGDWVDDDPGANANSSCIDFVSLRNKTVLLPVYGETRGTGINGEYRVIGFAAFVLTGYRFPPPLGRWPSNMTCPDAPGQSGQCLRGHFTGLITTGTVFGGPDSDLGVTIIKLVG